MIIKALSFLDFLIYKLLETLNIIHITTCSVHLKAVVVIMAILSIYLSVFNVTRHQKHIGAWQYSTKSGFIMSGVAGMDNVGHWLSVLIRIKLRKCEVWSDSSPLLSDRNPSALHSH